MNIDKFIKTLELLYKMRGPFPYKAEEYLSVFGYFFAKYEEVRGEKHPPLKWEQILYIMEAMPDIDGQAIDPDEYPDLIDQYFKTKFRRSDYRINHFFSGNVRQMRVYELM